MSFLFWSFRLAVVSLWLIKWLPTMNTNINIQLPKDHIPHIKEYYLSRLKQLETEVLDIRTLLTELDLQNNAPALMLGQLSIPHATQPTNGYNPKWSLIKKAKFALNLAGRPMTSKEIVDFIIDNYDSALKPDRKRFMSSMSGTLSAKSKEGGIFTRSQNDADDFEYLIA